MSVNELDEIRHIFANNLKRYLEFNERTQTDLQKYMHVSSSTASDWIHGIKMPRMDKIQSICNWLHIEKSDLLEDKPSPKPIKASPETVAKFSPLLEQLSPDELAKVYEYATILLQADKYQKQKGENEHLE